MNTETIVRIINDELIVNTGIDWVAIIALVFSILSTIGILLWQSKLRKEEKEEQSQRLKKEDEISRWNAEYPYKIKLFTEYYDTLYRFVNYKGSVKEKLGNSGTKTYSSCRIRAIDIIDMCSLFNKYAEEAKVLFSTDIQNEIEKNYKKVEKFVNNPIKQGLSLSEYTFILENDVNSGIYEKIKDSLEILQNEIKGTKQIDISRESFIKELKIESKIR